jgi:hypothetical protein
LKNCSKTLKLDLTDLSDHFNDNIGSNGLSKAKHISE